MITNAKENKKSVIKRILLMVGLVCIFVTIGTIFQPVFETNDDRTMKDILSGNYTGTPDGHAIFMMYPLAKVISLLYSCMPSLPWYGIFFGMCLIYCAYVVTYEIIFYTHKNKTVKYLTLFIALVVLFSIYINNFIVQQWTVIAGILGGTAVFFTIMEKRKIAVVVLLSLCFLVRSDVFILACPFVVAGVIWNKLYENAEIQWKKSIRYGMVMCLVLGLIFVVGTMSNKIFYASDEWKDFQQYNEARSSLYDYTYIRAEGMYKQALIEKGMKLEDYNLINSYNLLLDNNITKEKLEQTYEIVKKLEQTDSFMIKTVKTIYHVLQIWVLKYWQYSILLIALYIGIILNAKKNKRYANLCIILCVFIGKNIILFYLLWMGRFVPRVFYAIYVIEFLFLTAIIINMIRSEELVGGIIKSKRQNAIGITLTLCIVGSLILQTAGYLGVRSKLSDDMEQWTTVINYCNANGKMYLIDINSFDECTGFVYRNDDIVKNSWYLEPWLARSPLTKQKLNMFGVSDCGELLYFNKDVYYIVKSERDYNWMEEYFIDRFGNCEFVKKDMIECSHGAQYDVIKIEALAKEEMQHD